jgi:dephospho-CoA kinase
VPLLYEGNLQSRFNYVICIFANDEERKKRFKERFKHHDADEIFTLIEKVQLPQLKKVALIYFHVYNINNGLS